jgi:hypothetical protein
MTHDLYFTVDGQKYCLETNVATGDRTLCIVTAPGLAFQLTGEAIERLDLWTHASNAWAARFPREVA